MAYKPLLVAIMASIITLFALQNGAPTSIRFLLWKLETVPLATLILVAVAAGVVLVGSPPVIDRRRLRARVRELEARAAAAEALLSQRTAPPEAPGPA